MHNPAVTFMLHTEFDATQCYRYVVNIIVFMLRVCVCLEVSCLTRVKEIGVVPLLLIMMQRPKVDNDSSSFFNFEIPNTAKKEQSKTLILFFKVLSMLNINVL